jgi:Fe-S-cluster-containing dehydrogenase component
VAKCINCHNCVLATKDEHVGNDFPGYAVAQPPQGHEWISIERHTRGTGTAIDVTYVPRMCNHCDDAPCIKAAGDGAVYKRSDGIVIVDPVKAHGRRELVDSCPYGAMTWNEVAEVPQIWIFDAHLLDQGLAAPRCVQVCPTGALEVIHDSDDALREIAARDDLQPLHPELNTRPRVLYRNLQRIRSVFLSGNVVSTLQNGRNVNVENATVSLVTGGGAVLQSTTDAFGDFKFDGLARASGDYRLHVAHDDYGRAERCGALLDSVHLGSIELRLPVRSVQTVGAGGIATPNV